jgi:hypothetical protein
MKWVFKRKLDEIKENKSNDVIGTGQIVWVAYTSHTKSKEANRIQNRALLDTRQERQNVSLSGKAAQL